MILCDSTVTPGTRSGAMIPSARMTLAAILATAMLAALPAHALSVRDFDAKPSAEQSAIVIAFVDKLTADIGRDNPQLAKGIHDYFFLTPQGERYSEGLWNLYVEIAALETVEK